jgi:tight adherence protein B
VGRDLGDALDEVAERMASDDFRWVAQAIGIHREVGGNLAEVLDTVGHTIRERNAIRRQVKALSAEGKLSAVVLMSLPFGIVGFLSVTNPAYLAAFTESLIGWCMTAAVVVLLVIGGLWLKKTVAIRF